MITGQIINIENDKYEIQYVDGSEVNFTLKYNGLNRGQTLDTELIRINLIYNSDEFHFDDFTYSGITMMYVGYGIIDDYISVTYDDHVIKFKSIYDINQNIINLMLEEKIKSMIENG